jgi:hypothetical protein
MGHDATLGLTTGLLLDPDMDWTPPAHRRLALRPAGFVEPSIPTLADRLLWRDGDRVRLFTRRVRLDRSISLDRPVGAETGLYPILD